MALLEVRNLQVNYGPIQAVKGIDLDVEKGTLVALLGANGAGKTTLLSLMLADNPIAYALPVRLFGRKRGSGESIWDIKRKI